MSAKSKFIVCALFTTVCGSALATERKGIDKPFLSEIQRMTVQPTPGYLPAGCIKGTKNPSCFGAATRPVNGRSSLSASDDLAINAPNVLVTMYVKEISNAAVSNGGFDPEDPKDVGNKWIRWDTASPEADVQSEYGAELVIPNPGITNDYTTFYNPVYGIGIYQALIYGACDSLSSFDLTHTVRISDHLDNADWGFYEATDTDTIDSTGFYNMSYSVVATEDEDGDKTPDQTGGENNGGVSNIHITGTVNVTCTAASSL